MQSKDHNKIQEIIDAYYEEMHSVEEASIEIINPESKEVLEIEVSESEDISVVKDCFKHPGSKVIVIDREKESKEKKIVNEKFDSVFKENGLPDGLATGGDLSGPDVWFTMVGQCYIAIKIADFVIDSILGDIKNKIWEKIKSAFKNVFTGTKNRKHILITLQALNGRSIVLILKKDLTIQNYIDAMEKISSVLKSHKGDQAFYLYDEKLNKWKKPQKSIVLK